MSAHVRARRTIFLLAAGFLVGVIATIGFNLGPRVEAISFWGQDQPAEQAATPTPGAQVQAQAQVPLSSLPDFSRLAEKLSPAVVNVSTTSQGETSPQMQGPFGGGDPHEFWEPFERFFGPLPKHPFKQRSLGSGFIVNHDGVILTDREIRDSEQTVCEHGRLCIRRRSHNSGNLRVL